MHLTTIDNLLRNIYEEVEEIVNYPIQPGREEFRNWMVNEVIKKEITKSNTVINNKKQQEYFINMNKCKILSPSDVGIHNTMEYEGKLTFLDFEYAGYDDLAKLTNDWVLQPEFPLNKEKEHLMIEYFGRIDIKANKSKNWVQRYFTTKKLYHFKCA